MVLTSYKLIMRGSDGMKVFFGIPYYLIVYILEFIKFFLIDKYMLDWKQKKWNWKKVIVAGIGFLGIAFFFSYVSEQINPLPFYILFLIVETFIVFEEVAWKMIGATLIEMYAISMIDAMIHQMYEVLLELLKIDLQLSMDLLVSVTTILFFASIIYALGYKVQGYVRNISIRYYVIFIILATGNSIILAEFERIIKIGTIQIRIAFIFIVLGIFLELALLLILAATREVYKEKDLLNQKYLQWQETHYKYLEQRETATKKFRHDMRNHIYILQHLLEQGKQEEAKQYADQLEQHFTAMGIPISVNHGIVDAILNKYATECKEKQIPLSVKGYMPKKCGVSSFDLCVIFSNLLSNAIEATEKCAEKGIHLELRHEDDFFMLCIKNTFDGKLLQKNGSIQTRKQDKESHGYGLANVKECVERNQGHMNIKQQEKQFVVTLYMKVPYLGVNSLE